MRLCPPPLLPGVCAFLAVGVQSGTAQMRPKNALPGCEPRPEVSRTLEAKLDASHLDHMKAPERFSYERQTLTALIAQYPRELNPTCDYGSLC